MKFEYQVMDDMETELNPTMELILSYVKKMNNIHSSFCVLTDERGSILQCLGGIEGDVGTYILQYIHEEKGQESCSYVGAKNKVKQGWWRLLIERMIVKKDEPRDHEILDIEQVEEILTHFYQGGTIPDSYLLRNINP